MAGKGPQRTPTNILKMRGSSLAKRRVDEPQPQKKRPQHAPWINQWAKQNYKRLAPQIEAMGILGRCDRDALMRYCVLLARWREMEEFVDKHGAVYIDGNDIIEYPQAKRALTLADKLLKLEREFGLTPSARAGMAKVRDNPDENRGKDKSRFFKNG